MAQHSAEWLRGAAEALEGLARALETPSLRLLALECRNRASSHRAQLAAAEAREAEEVGLVEQLATAQAEAKRLAAIVHGLTTRLDLRVIPMELAPEELLGPHDARMKRLGAAEWLRDNSNAEWLDVDQRERFRFEADRLMEGE